MKTDRQTTPLASACRAIPFSTLKYGHALKEFFIWRRYCGKKQIDSAWSILLSTMKFVIAVVKICYNILTTLITNIVVDKSRDHAENLSICLIEHLFMDINGLNWVYTGAWEVSIKCHWPGSAENEFKTKHSTKITNLKQAVTFKSIVIAWSTNVLLPSDCATILADAAPLWSVMPRSQYKITFALS